MPKPKGPRSNADLRRTERIDFILACLPEELLGTYAAQVFLRHAHGRRNLNFDEKMTFALRVQRMWGGRFEPGNKVFGRRRLTREFGAWTQLSPHEHWRLRWAKHLDETPDAPILFDFDRQLWFIHGLLTPSGLHMRIDMRQTSPEVIRTTLTGSLQRASQRAGAR